MEKRTTGQFIAALRKANGMTQKELAEKLFVSDKAVSRWEREESSPDLSLIPVIAEIFGVTSDEILRGERRSTPNPSDEINSEKAKKQLHSLINKSKVKFMSSSIISAGIAGVGLIAAMIVNFGFSRAHIGFFIGCVFYLVALICESVCWLITTSALRMEGAEIKELQVVKDSITK